MADAVKNENVTSTNFHSEVFFAPGDNDAKTRRLGMQLFERGLITSIHHMDTDRKFIKKANKTHFINQNDFDELILMLNQALVDHKEKKDFELVMIGKKSAFGVFGVKKEGNYIAGYSIYDANEGIIVQNSKDVCPIMNKTRVKRILQDGEQEDLIQNAFVVSCKNIIGKLKACQTGESGIFAEHIKKLNNKFTPQNREENVSSDVGMDEDEFPF